MAARGIWDGGSRGGGGRYGCGGGGRFFRFRASRNGLGECVFCDYACLEIVIRYYMDLIGSITGVGVGAEMVTIIISTYCCGTGLKEQCRLLEPLLGVLEVYHYAS